MEKKDQKIRARVTVLNVLSRQVDWLARASVRASQQQRWLWQQRPATTKHPQKLWIALVHLLTHLLKNNYIWKIEITNKKEAWKNPVIFSISPFAAARPRSEPFHLLQISPRGTRNTIFLIVQCSYTAIFVSFRFLIQLYFFSIVQIWSPVENGRCWRSHFSRTGRLGR